MAPEDPNTTTTPDTIGAPPSSGEAARAPESAPQTGQGTVTSKEDAARDRNPMARGQEGKQDEKSRKAAARKAHGEQKHRINDAVRAHKTVAGGVEAAFNMLSSNLLSMIKEGASPEDLQDAIELARADQHELIDAIVAGTKAQ